MRKENNGLCREKNEKLRKVKACRKINLHYDQLEKLENHYKTLFWKSQHFFLKANTSTCLDYPSPYSCLFLFAFQWLLPPLLNEFNFWMTSWHSPIFWLCFPMSVLTILFIPYRNFLLLIYQGKRQIARVSNRN